MKLTAPAPPAWTRASTSLALMVVCASCATTPPSAPPPPPEPAPVVTTLDNGVRLVTTASSYELAIYLLLEPELEPLELEGATALLAELSLEGAGHTDAASPRARALALGAELEPFLDGTLVGWRLTLAALAPPAAANGTACADPGCDARLGPAWDLLLDVALAPDLRASTVTRRAEQARDRNHAEGSPALVAARRWAAALAADLGRPLGTSPTDRAASLVNRENLARLHRALFAPARLIIVGPPLTYLARARLAALTPPEPGPRVRCPAPLGRVFGLAAPMPPIAIEGRSAPGRGVPGRAELEWMLDLARATPALAGARVELVDFGEVAALTFEGAATSPTSLSAWLAAAEALARAQPAPPEPGATTWTLAHRAALGRPGAGAPSLGPPLTVWVGALDHVPSPPIVLPEDAPRCRP